MPLDKDRPCIDVEETMVLFQKYSAVCQKLKSVPVSRFQHQMTLSSVSLRYSALGPGDIAAIVTVLQECEHLTTLNLKGNNSGRLGCAAISRLLLVHPYIRGLDLSENNVSTQELHILNEALKYNITLETLSLAGNELNDSTGVILADIIKHNTVLLDLDLSYNTLGERVGRYLASAIGTNKSLRILDLRWNHLRQKGCAAVISGIKRNMCLKTLKLAWNGLSDGGCDAIQTMLMKNVTLEHLDISHSRICLHGFSHIVKGIAVNQTLKTLKIDGNTLTTEGTRSLVLTLLKVASPALSLIDMQGTTIDKTLIEAAAQSDAKEVDFQGANTIAATIPTNAVLVQNQSRNGNTVLLRHGSVVRQTGAIDPIKTFLVDSQRPQPWVLLLQYMRQHIMRAFDLFKKITKTNRKWISKKEFKNFFHNTIETAVSEVALNKLADALDFDEDGVITLRDMKDAFKKHSHQVRPQNGHLTPYQRTLLQSAQMWHYNKL